MATVWEWCTDAHKFVPFAPRDNAAIEKGYATGASTLSHRIGKEDYTIDFTNLVQRNDKTKRERQIRRVGADGSLLMHGYVWEWESSHGGAFTPYDRATSDAIEREFLAESLVCKVVVPTSAHETGEMVIHFGTMTQENRSNAKAHGTRKVRRVLKKITPSDGTGITAPPALAAAAAAAAATKRVREAPEAPTSKRKPAPSVATEAAEKSEEGLAAKRKRADEGEAAADIATLGKLLPTPRAENASLALSDWVHDQSCLVLAHLTAEDMAAPSIKLAAFDMDDTLVMPDGKHTFAKSRTDWKWLLPEVPTKLQGLRRAGFRIVIFSNQSGVANKGWNATLAAQLQGKIIDLAAAAKVPISAVIATKEDEFRKPLRGMAAMYLRHMGNGRPIDRAQSFYVGDAAGRAVPTLAGRKKDFSCSDRKFAYNLRLPFHTPEEFFQGKSAAPFEWDGLGPADLEELPATYPPAASFLRGAGDATNPEMVVFSGFPGCGKSTFFRRVLAPHGYVHVNRDTLGKWEACVAAADKALASGKSVAIDNTNPSPEERQRYLAVAKKHRVPARSFLFTHSQKLANHMNILRARLQISARVPTMAYNIYKSKFKEPTTEEGFAAVVRVPPVADFSDLPPGAREMFLELS